MNKPNVYIAERLPQQVEQYIAKYCKYEKWNYHEKVPKEMLFEKLADKEGVMLTDVRIDDVMAITIGSRPICARRGILG